MVHRLFEKAEILCVGTELLIGDIVNTNAAYLSRRLATLGIGVYRQAVVGDNPSRLAEDLRAALSRADLVVMSGGLGPTYDDLTKETAATVMGKSLYMHQPSLARIERFFASTGRTMTDNNKKQAMMPEGATVFPNDYGTAPALAMENEEGKVVVMLPGPPRELEPLFREQVEPYLAKRCSGVLFSRNLHIIGMGESSVEASLPREILDSKNPTVAPYCDTGEVRLRVTAKAATVQEATQMADQMVERLMTLPLAAYVYGIDVPTPAHALVSLLRKHGLTVGAAESCTGGLVASELTAVAGCSDVMAGGIVSYQEREKIALLGVSPEALATHTAVSEVVARQMAEGAARALKVDLAIATTGYAGPGGGTPDDPIGTVYIAVSFRGETVTQRLTLSSHRDRKYIRDVACKRAVSAALALLREKTENS